MASPLGMAGNLPRRYVKDSHGDWQISDISSHANEGLIIAGFSRELRQTCVDILSKENKVIFEKTFFHKGDADIDDRVVASMNSGEFVTGCGRKVQVVTTFGTVVSTYTLKRGPVTCIGISSSKSIVYVGRIDSSDILALGRDMKLRQTLSIPGDKIYGIIDVAAFNDRVIICTASGPLMSFGNVTMIDAPSNQIIGEYRTILGNHFCPKSVVIKQDTSSLVILWSFVPGTGYYTESEYHLTIHSLDDNKEHCQALCVLNKSARKIAENGENRLAILDPDGDVTNNDIADFFSFDNLITSLSELLQSEDCAKLCTYFQINPEHAAKLFTSRKPGKSLMTTLEEKRIVQRTDVFSLREAFKSLNMPNAHHLVEGYLNKSETPLVSRFGKFVAEFSTFLTSSLFEAVCEHFSISESEKNEILTDNAPGLSLLSTLQEKNIITPTDVRALEIPAFADLKQIVAKINRYQRDVRESEMFSPGTKRELTTEEKAAMFSNYLHRHITNWYESICPLPWKKACQWTLSDLFIACGLTLTSTRSQTVLKNVDTRCNITFGHIFTHKDLKNARRIVVEGNPGSGKTMLASQIAYDWVKGKLEDIKYAILLQLKYVEDMTIPEAIMKLILPVDSPLTLADVESILAETDPLKVCLILDGLEEYTGGGGDKSSDPKQCEVMKVMYQEKMSECKVIITTRSEYLQDLPNCPMLKIRQFGEEERKNYVEKMFPHDTDKQRNVIMTVENNPLLLELCDVPLLFVMAVHNIDKITKVSQNETEKVTPFVQNIVETLCTVEGKEPLLPDELDEGMESPDSDGEDTIDSEDSENFRLTLEEVAFNGLCTGKQQLSWPMDFVKDKMCNVRSWIDSGILIVEEEVRRTKEDITDKSDVRPEQTQTTGAVADVPTPSSKREEGNFTVMDIDDMPPEIQDEGPSSSGVDDVARSGKKQQPEMTTEKVTTKNAITVLQARFLHKIIQEWFAAKHLANLLENFSQDEVDRCLNLISPIELHYILRFACGINGRVTPLILTHVNHYYHALDHDDDKRRPVADCICQCFVEHFGEKETLKEIIENFCNKGITLCEEGSRQLHRAKIFLLNFASENKIVVPKVNLVDVCNRLLTEENEVRLYLNTGVYLTSLQAVNSVRITSWSAKLEEFNFNLLLEYLDSWSSLQEVELHFPVQPPVLGEELKDKISLTHKKVTWTIGAMTHYLDKNGVWCLKNVKGESSSQKPVYKRQRRQDEPSAEGESSHGAMAKADETRSGEPSVEEESDPRKKVYHTATKRRRMPSEVIFSQKEPLSIHLDNLRVRKNISQNGGILHIPNSGVELTIPPNSFWEDDITYPIEMRIIPRGTFDEPAKSFADNSSVMVELLPNNLRLRHPALLTLPHCLVLRNVWTCPVRIFVSHHDEENRPKWEEITSTTHHELSECACKIWLTRFCWVKYEIDGEEVEAKKLVVYTAGHKCRADTRTVIVDVGYYPELVGANELLRAKLRDIFLADRQPFLFRKEPKNPLQITSMETIPDEWKASQSSSSPKTISYFNIASSNEQSCPFVFQRCREIVNLPVCLFKLSQGEESTQLSIDMDQSETIRDVLTSNPDPGMLSEDQYYGAIDELPPELLTSCEHMTLSQKDKRPLLSLSRPASLKDDQFERGIPSSIRGASASSMAISLSPPSLPVYNELRYPDLVQLAMCLDPPATLHNDWRTLADKLNFTVEHIRYFEQVQDSPTMTVLETAMASGVLQTKSQLTDILKEMKREDAVKAISK